MFMDTMDDKLALNYEAGAFRGYIIERETHTVAHSMCFGPANVAGKLIGLAKFAEALAAQEKDDMSVPNCSIKIG